MATVVQSGKSLAKKPAPQQAAAAPPLSTVQAPATPLAFWGDRFTFLFWLACAGLLIVLHFSDLWWAIFGHD
jgi:hypothetical protein